MRYFSCSGLIPTGGAATPESQGTRLPEDQLFSLLKTATDYCAQSGASLSFTSPGWLSDAQLRRLHLTIPACGACLSNMAVAPDGSVVPCQSWLGGQPLGNLLRDCWDDIWRSPRCVDIRKRATDSKVCLLGEEARA